MPGLTQRRRMSSSKVSQSQIWAQIDTTSPRTVHESDPNAFGHAVGDAFGVPIRQSDAAVRLGLGHLPRKRSAMDAVTLSRKVDPHRADRVVRPGPDRERFA